MRIRPDCGGKTGDIYKYFSAVLDTLEFAFFGKL
jgi:hypothetical protein